MTSESIQFTLFVLWYTGSGTLELPHFETLQIVTAISADIKPELQKFGEKVLLQSATNAASFKPQNQRLSRLVMGGVSIGPLDIQNCYGVRGSRE
ncbi:hypothetical protein LENED_001469 [Lentinula edodes]|uniref:Uncharacterized protein n=1 Tax=Lentinula edodes TaxID=5353 RepID=A0A1Q3DYB0_LENED|nr:hypothetical protein LENED_001469 [Lentinula edodes]